MLRVSIVPFFGCVKKSRRLGKVHGTNREMRCRNDFPIRRIGFYGVWNYGIGHVSPRNN